MHLLFVRSCSKNDCESACIFFSSFKKKKLANPGASVSSAEFTTGIFTPNFFFIFLILSPGKSLFCYSYLLHQKTCIGFSFFKFAVKSVQGGRMELKLLEAHQHFSFRQFMISTEGQNDARFIAYERFSFWLSVRPERCFFGVTKRRGYRYRCVFNRVYDWMSIMLSLQ